MTNVVCPICSSHIHQKPKRSFWGLWTIRCDRCHYQGEIPFEGVYKVVCIILAVLVIVTLLVRLSGNEAFNFGFLELFGYLAIIALIKNWLVSRRIKSRIIKSTETVLGKKIKEELDDFEKLDKLARVREKGILTQEEFEAKKKKILKIWF